MAQILVRNLPETVKSRLRENARRHGRSLEEEARSALSAAAFAVEPERGLGSRMAQRFQSIGLKHGEELARPPASRSSPAKFD